MYQDPKNGVYTLSATVAGKRFKINRGRRCKLRQEAALFADKIAKGMPERVEMGSDKKLEYFLAHEHRIGGRPLDVAVEFYLAHQDEKLVSKMVPELVKDFLDELEPSVSKRYFDRMEDELNLFAKSFNGAISEISSADIAEWITKRKVGNLGRCRRV